MAEILKIDGIPKLEARLGELIGLFSSADVKEVYMDGARVVLDEFRRSAPVVTGRFQRSAFIARGRRDKADVLLMLDYSVCPYAHIVEYGTATRAPHATLRRAILTTAPEVEQTIEAGLKQKVEDKF